MPVQRLECRPPFDPRPMGSEQRVKRLVAFPPDDARDLTAKPVTTARHGLDVRPLDGWVAKHSPQRGNHLLDAVVGDHDIAPHGRNQVVPRHDRSGIRDQMQQYAQLTIGQRDRLTGAR